MVLVEGIAVSGEYVEGLKDKTFTVIKAPQYVDLPDMDDPTKKVRKLLLFVELANGEQMDYYPNKTSIKMMTAQFGFEMDKWLSARFKWEVTDQKAFGKDVKVLFVAAERLK